MEMIGCRGEGSVVGPLLAARALPLRRAAALLVQIANWANLACLHTSISISTTAHHRHQQPAVPSLPL
jgi:hypothetical protein